MPCCCASNIKAAFVIGIVLAVLYTLSIAISFHITKIFSIITGFLGLVSASILAYGAHTRNSKAMLIYTGSAILIIILTIIGVVHGIISGDNNLSKEVFKAFLKMFLLIIVKIWVVQMTIKSVWI